MTPSRARRSRRRLLTVGLAVLAGIVSARSVGAVPEADGSARQATDSGITVDVTQLDGLADGQVIDVTVTPTAGVSAGQFPQNGVVAICRDDATYAGGSPAGSRFPELAAAAQKCPSPGAAFSSAATRTSATLYPMPDGSRWLGSVRVGVGTAPSADGSPALSCGPDNPCRLVMAVPVVRSGSLVWTVETRRITFQPADPTAAACHGGSAGGELTSTGPDRLFAAYVAWAIDQCGSSGGTRSTSFVSPAAEEVDGTVLAGEQKVLADFASGARDIAYSAVGPAAPGFAPAANRSSVAVPVAVNAMVLGMAGGYNSSGAVDWPIGLKRPYAPVALDADQLGVVLGQGTFWGFLLNPELTMAMRTANPELALPDPLYPDDKGYRLPLAYGSPDAGTLFVTSYLDALAPDVWKVPDHPVFAERGRNEARSAVSSFSTAQPGFQSVLTTFSNRSGLDRAVNDVREATQTFGPVWVLTDYATATELDLTLAAIPNRDGELVAPTPASIAAGVATMSPQADGTLAPDPTQSAAGAYPLPMIEYAWAPREPLVDATTCEPRAASQALLTSWLDYVTSEGQAQLADFVPLTPALADQAESAITEVGTAPSTAVCPGGPPGSGPGAVVPPISSAGGVGPGTGARTASQRGTGSSAETDLEADLVREPTPEGLDEAAKAAEETDPSLPAFLGVAEVSEVLSPLALLLLVILTSATAFLTAGQPLPGPVRRLPRRLGGAAGRVAQAMPRPGRRPG
jgi:hypothetical protein